MKRAILTFPVDNGTVYEGQVLPDGSAAVLRYPANFVTVPDGTPALDGLLTELTPDLNGVLTVPLGASIATVTDAINSLTIDLPDGVDVGQQVQLYLVARSAGGNGFIGLTYPANVAQGGQQIPQLTPAPGQDALAVLELVWLGDAWLITTANTGSYSPPPPPITAVPTLTARLIDGGVIVTPVDALPDGLQLAYSTGSSSAGAAAGILDVPADGATVTYSAHYVYAAHPSVAGPEGPVTAPLTYHAPTVAPSDAPQVSAATVDGGLNVIITVPTIEHAAAQYSLSVNGAAATVLPAALVLQTSLGHPGYDAFHVPPYHSGDVLTFTVAYVNAAGVGPASAQQTVNV